MQTEEPWTHQRPESFAFFSPSANNAVDQPCTVPLPAKVKVKDPNRDDMTADRLTKNADRRA